MRQGKVLIVSSKLDLPVVLIREVQQPTGNTTFLENVEQTQTLRFGQAIVFGTVDDQGGSAELQNVLRCRGVPTTVVVSVGPEGAVELSHVRKSLPKHKWKRGETHIMLSKPELFSGDLGISHKGSIMGDKCLELPSQRVTLDPIHHETSITGTRSDTVVCVDEVKVVSDILPGLDQIIVGVATCEVGQHDAATASR
jgi:hypothetical protein